MEAELSMSKVFDHASKLIKAYHSQLQPLARQAELPPLALDILLFIANNPMHATAKEICLMRGIKPGIASVHIERMVQIGYLARSAVEGDRRKTLLASTQKASDLVAQGREIQRNFADQLAYGISEEDMAVWKRILDTLNRNLEKMDRS